jgi:hypothetical protein
MGVVSGCSWRLCDGEIGHTRRKGFDSFGRDYVFGLRAASRFFKVVFSAGILQFSSEPPQP